MAQIEIPEIRKKITEELIFKYGSVKAFAESPNLLKKAKLDMLAPATIQSVLAGSGSTSFTVYQRLWKFLGFGQLDKVTVKTTTYHDESKDAESIEQ